MVAAAPFSPADSAVLLVRETSFSASSMKLLNIAEVFSAFCSILFNSSFDNIMSASVSFGLLYLRYSEGVTPKYALNARVNPS